MIHKYGYFSKEQMDYNKSFIRKSIFFLLLCVDPKTKDDYLDIDVPRAFESLLYKLGGMNEVLYEPPELVSVISLLQAALTEYLSPTFEFKKYRKLLLDSGAEVLKIKDGDNID